MKWIHKRNNVRFILLSGFWNLIYDSDRKEEKETDIKKTFNGFVKGFVKVAYRGIEPLLQE